MRTQDSSSSNGASKVKVELGGEIRWATPETMFEVGDELVARHGGKPTFTKVDISNEEPGDLALRYASENKIATKPSRAPKPVSEFGEGNQIVDEEAKARIEKTHEALRAQGVAVNAGSQLYATGTRMAQVGYNTQAARKAEHDAKTLLVDAAAQLAERVTTEARFDIPMGSRELARAIKVNGKITVNGYALSEQAIRGICGRVESPSLRYLLGLRERIAGEYAARKFAADAVLAEGRQPTKDEVDLDLAYAARMQLDRNKLADVLCHELRQLPETELKLRARNTPHDIFAAVSPGYVAADAPQVIEQMLAGMPSDARGSFAYDPVSTSWELRAEVWTPTPVEEQAVGEPFQGYASFGSKDNGTGKFRGGGGIVLLACLNAGTYIANGARANRIHRGSVLVDIASMIETAKGSIHALCAALGQAREQVIEEPKGIPMSEAFPGFWRWLLSDRRSELAAVLPGRVEKHVKQLVEVQAEQRRDSERLVRSDFYQGWTRYIQEQPSDVRREAEIAAGAFLTSQKRVGCTLRDEA